MVDVKSTLEIILRMYGRKYAPNMVVYLLLHP